MQSFACSNESWAFMSQPQPTNYTIVSIYFQIPFFCTRNILNNLILLFCENLLWMFLFICICFCLKHTQPSHIWRLPGISKVLVAFFICLYICDFLFAFFLLFSRFNQRILSLLISLWRNVASSNPVQGCVQWANTHLHKRLWLRWRMVFEGLCGRIGKWHSKSSS